MKSDVMYGCSWPKKTLLQSVILVLNRTPNGSLVFCKPMDNAFLNSFVVTNYVEYPLCKPIIACAV
jgi:hypothetical protein